MNPIETAPKTFNRKYILLIGDSGYVGTPYRCEVGYWSVDKNDWLTHSNDRFTDGGEPPIGWLPLPWEPK